MGLSPRPENRVVTVDPQSQEGWVTTRLDFLVNWSRANSLWPMPFGTACCAIEFMAAGASQNVLANGQILYWNAIEGSEDLKYWRTLAGAATVLYLEHAGQRLERRRIELASDRTYLKCREAVLKFLHERHRFIEAAE